MVKKSAKPYARALFELVTEEKSSEKVNVDLRGVKKLLVESKDLQDLLFKKVFGGQEKAMVLKTVLEKLSLHSTTQKFLLYLASQNRFYLFFDIFQEFERQIEEQKGIARARVFTAIELSVPLQKKVEEKFESWTGKKLEVTYEVDPSLVGGIVAKIGNTVLDGSILTELRQLKTQLEQGASHGN